MTETNSKQVSVSGYNDKYSITATFTITYLSKCYHHRGIIRSDNIEKVSRMQVSLFFCSVQTQKVAVIHLIY